MMKKFQIAATKFYWINGEADDPEDLCLQRMAPAQKSMTTGRESITMKQFCYPCTK